MIPLDVAPEPQPDEGLLRSYLLRNLAQNQREAVECRFLADDLFFELAQAVESDLLADYAAGELSAAEAEVVRGWLASSPTVRARLAVIRELQAATQSARRSLRSKARH